MGDTYIVLLFDDFSWDYEGLNAEAFSSKIIQQIKAATDMKVSVDIIYENMMIIDMGKLYPELDEVKNILLENSNKAYYQTNYSSSLKELKITNQEDPNDTLLSSLIEQINQHRDSIGLLKEIACLEYSLKDIKSTVRNYLSVNQLWSKGNDRQTIKRFKNSVDL